jgi:hypothetical protein
LFFNNLDSLDAGIVRRPLPYGAHQKRTIMKTLKTCWNIVTDAEESLTTVEYFDQDGSALKRLLIRLDDYEEPMVRLLALHGLKQRLGDSSAGFKAVKDEAGWDIALDWAKMNHLRVHEQQKEGTWTTRGEGTIRVTLLHEAISRVYGESLEVVIAKLESMTKEERAALAKVAKIAQVITEVKAERALAKAERAKAKAVEGGELPDLF